MASIHDAIGKRFERFLMNRFSGLDQINRGSSCPDFYCPSGKFYIEAKVGNQEWGPRLKDYQISNFKNINEPVVYALGFHDFKDAGKTLKGLDENEMGDFLDENMSIKRFYFIDSQLIKNIWKKERRTSVRRQIPYFIVKESLLRNITLDRNFKRFGNPIDSAEKYYKFNRDDFYMRLPNTNTPHEWGTILHYERNKKVIQYLNKISSEPAPF